MRATLVRAAIRVLIAIILMSASLASVHAGLFTTLTEKMSTSMSGLPRYEKLPLFDPHRKSFTCNYQDQHVPAIDPQAEQWFQQALALDDLDIYYEKRDYERIYQLYRQAAERGHWKAMLNLATLILSDYAVPEHDPELAIRWVEKAMRLGVPDAYDVMGTYHQNGLVKGGDATNAYAFFQRAADMGSPSAMTYLGYKIAGNYDNPKEGFWGNVGVGTKMLECALAQGYGDAAEKLGLIYARPRTAESKRRALETLHEGVKLGSALCANSLAPEFRGLGMDDGSNLVGHVDKARADRYSTIGDALDHYQGRLKLPNLDKVLPLPPAPLPKWDGDEDTLINAAKAVVPPPELPPRTQKQGREAMPDGHDVRPLQESLYVVDGTKRVPESGYWLAVYLDGRGPDAKQVPARSRNPERYNAGERFEPPTAEWLPAQQVQWHFLGEARPLPPQREVFVKTMTEAGWLRELRNVSAAIHCNGMQTCPETGIWESRIANDHPLARLYNRWNQQAFVEAGRAFPDAGRRYLNIVAADVRWTFLGSPNALRSPGVYDIAL